MPTLRTVLVPALLPLLAAADHAPFSVAFPAPAGNLTVEAGSAADVSALLDPPTGSGRPAQQHGFVVAEGGRFQFEDGQAGRFWGLNWPAGRPMPVGEQGAGLAQRLARQGVNLLRIQPPPTNQAGDVRRFEEFSGYLKAQGIYLDVLLAASEAAAAVARTNRVTRFAPREDAGIALFEFIPNAAVKDVRAALRKADARAPVAAAGPLRKAGDAASLGTNDFLSQTVEWSGAQPMVKSSRTLFGPMSFGAPRTRPWVVGSWTVAGTNAFRTELPLWTAATAAFQNWAGVCGSPASTNAAEDIVAWAWAPASALMFHRGDLAAGHGKILFHLPANDKAASALRSSHEQFAAAAGLSLVRFSFEPVSTNATPNPPGWMVVGGVEMGAVSGLNPRTTDTGEMSHDWQAGQLKINTPRTQALIGFFGGQLAETRDLRVASTNRFSAVALSSLDGKPLPASQRLLLTATGRADPTGAPRLEPLEGAVTLKWLAPSQREHKIFALDLSGHRTQEVPLADRGFRLRPELNSVWYEIIAASALPQTNALPAKAR